MGEGPCPRSHHRGEAYPFLGSAGMVPGTQRQAASREREPSFRTESQATDLLRAGKAAEAREQWKERTRMGCSPWGHSRGQRQSSEGRRAARLGALGGGAAGGPNYFSRVTAPKTTITLCKHEAFGTPDFYFTALMIAHSFQKQQPRKRK